VLTSNSILDPPNETLTSPPPSCLGLDFISIDPATPPYAVTVPSIPPISPEMLIAVKTLLSIL